MLDSKQSKIWQFFLIQGENNPSFSCPFEPIIKLIQDLIATYILAKFGADWLISIVTYCANRLGFKGRVNCYENGL